jgi:hypothetical protein
MLVRGHTDANRDWASVFVAAVVVPDQPVMPTRTDVLLSEANTRRLSGLAKGSVIYQIADTTADSRSQSLPRVI